MATLRTPSVSSSTTTTLSVTKPTGASTGDVCYIFALTTMTGTNSGASLSSISGFSDTGTVQNASNTSFGCRGYAKVLTGSESWPLSITVNGNISTAICACYGGAANFDPTTLPTPVYTNSGTTVQAAAVTLANSADWITWFAGSSRNASLSPFTITVPSGFGNTTDSGAEPGSTASIREYFCDLEAGQSAGSYTAPAGTLSTSGAKAVWAVGLFTELDATVGPIAPNIAVGAAGSIEIDVTLGPIVPNISVAAPAGTAGISIGPAVPNIAVAAPAGTALVSAQSIGPIAAHVTVAAPVGVVQNSCTLGPITPPNIAVTAPTGSVTAFVPVLLNPWYGNLISPNDSDFEGTALS